MDQITPEELAAKKYFEARAVSEDLLMLAEAGLGCMPTCEMELKRVADDQEKVPDAA